MKKGVFALLGITGMVTGAVAGGSWIGKICDKTIALKTDKINKFKSYYNMLNQWLILKQQGKTLEQYFVDNGYKTIAIYGMGEMGNRLYDELKESSIQVAYAIDQETSKYIEIASRSPQEQLDGVDVIVVTAVFAFEEIKNNISTKASCPIVSLEDIVNEV